MTQMGPGRMYQIRVPAGLVIVDGGLAVPVPFNSHSLEGSG
jgi:hypothetical protein